MKFYPVTIDGVPQLARTQKEAAVHGPVPEPIEIDVSQQPLMDHLNALMRAAHKGVADEVPAPAPDPVDLPPENSPNGRCKRCGTTQAGQQALIDGMDQDAIIARLEAGPDWMRKNVREALDENQ